MSKSNIQAVHFEKNKWKDTQCKRKLSDMGLKPMKAVHITPNFLEYRILSPTLFKRFITLKKRGGIQLIIGYKS